MQQCLIYNSSLKFSRATYGVLVLVAFFLHSQWLIFAISVLILLGAISLKLNIPYQLHALILNKNKIQPTPRELGELNFVATATGILLLIGFLFLNFSKFVNAAWVYILIVDLMIFLACFIGFCIATLMYIFFKKLFNKKSN